MTNATMTNVPAMAPPAPQPPSALRAELVKLGAIRSTWIGYALLLLLTIGFSVFVADNNVTEPPGALGDDDIVSDLLGGVLLGVIVSIVLGAVSIGGEIGSGMLATSFAAEPRRHRLVLAKACWAGALGTLLGTVGAVVSFVVARPVQRSHGYVEPGYPDPSLFDGEVFRAVVGSGVLIGLAGVFGVGVGAAVRRSSVAIAVSLASILVPPMLGIEGPMGRFTQRFTPFSGFAVHHTIERDDYYIAPLVGLGVFAAYAALALSVGIAVTRRADV